MRMDKDTYLREKLQNGQNTKRYAHTLGVEETAIALAQHYGYDEEKASLAALLHDCAKCNSDQENLTLCQVHNVEITEVEYNNLSLLHAKAGAILAEMEYDIEDEEILHAIIVHTTGEPNMSLLDKIIYVADYIEPGRKDAPNLECIRELAYQNLDACIAKICQDTLSYLVTRNQPIDPATERTYNFYKQYMEEDKWKC